MRVSTRVGWAGHVAHGFRRSREVTAAGCLASKNNWRGRTGWHWEQMVRRQCGRRDEHRGPRDWDHVASPPFHDADASVAVGVGLVATVNITICQLLARRGVKRIFFRSDSLTKVLAAPHICNELPTVVLLRQDVWVLCQVHAIDCLFMFAQGRQANNGR